MNQEDRRRQCKNLFRKTRNLQDGRQFSQKSMGVFLPNPKALLLGQGTRSYTGQTLIDWRGTLFWREDQIVYGLLERDWAAKRNKTSPGPASGGKDSSLTMKSLSLSLGWWLVASGLAATPDVDPPVSYTWIYPW